MRDDFRDLGLVRRRELRMSDGAISRAIRNGRLTRLYPGILAVPGSTISPSLRRRAALLHVGPDAHLSCASACAEWGLPVSDDAAVHVTTSVRQVRPLANLVPHRRPFAAPVARLDVTVSALDVAVVEAFGCLDRKRGLELVMAAVNERLVLPQRIRAAASTGVNGRPALLALLEDFSGGSHSVAEGMLLRLINAAGLPEPARQWHLLLDGRSAYLDMAFPAQRVAIEVDGKAWHFNPAQRTSDIRRDALLSASGWIVLRFLYEQIKNEPRWVTQRIADTLRARNS